MREHKRTGYLVPTLALGLCLLLPIGASGETVQWLDHLGFLAGDDTVVTAFNAEDSGVGGGLSGLIISSTTTGETTPTGGIKMVEQGVQLPPGYLVGGVRICYESTAAVSFISQVRLAQLQDPPATALVVLDDGTDLVDPGPVCVDSSAPFDGPVAPAEGALRLSLAVNFGDVNDLIVIRGVGLLVVPDPDSPIMQALQQIQEDLQNHTHDYLTGKGVGHNNVVATTGGAYLPEDQPATVVPFSKGKKKKK